MLEQYKEELASVRAAISKLTADPTSSQSVSSANGGSFSASYVNLPTLYSREMELIKIIADIGRAQEGIGLIGGLSYPIYCGG